MIAVSASVDHDFSIHLCLHLSSNYLLLKYHFQCKHSSGLLVPHHIDSSEHSFSKSLQNLEILSTQRLTSRDFSCPTITVVVVGLLNKLAIRSHPDTTTIELCCLLLLLLMKWVLL